MGGSSLDDVCSKGPYHLLEESCRGVLGVFCSVVIFLITNAEMTVSRISFKCCQVFMGEFLCRSQFRFC